MRLRIHSGTTLRRVSAMPWERGHSVDVGKPRRPWNSSADTTPSRAQDVGAVPYVGASDQLQIEERRCTTTTRGCPGLEQHRDRRTT
jgi:hypothetical protein